MSRNQSHTYTGIPCHDCGQAQLHPPNSRHRLQYHIMSCIREKLNAFICCKFSTFFPCPQLPSSRERFCVNYGEYIVSIIGRRCETVGITTERHFGAVCRKHPWLLFIKLLSPLTRFMLAYDIITDFLWSLVVTMVGHVGVTQVGGLTL